MIQNNQINKINQVTLAHHRTDFGLVFIAGLPKASEKRISSIGLTNFEKSPKNHPIEPVSRKPVLPGGFLDFSQNW